MLVVTRYRAPVGTPEADELRVGLERAHAVLAACPGYLGGDLGRNVDDPDLWALVTRWEHVGAYRRALSSYDVKLHAVPLLGRALDEPSAYESVAPGTDLNVAGSRSLG